MQSMYATFDSSLPDDSQEIGNKFIQPGFNVARRVQDGLKQRGLPVTEVENHEDFGWSFHVGPLGLFRRKPSVWCLFQVPDKWLLITEQSPGFFFFKDDAYYKQVLDEINAILVGDPAFSTVTWLSESEYNGPKAKRDVVFEPVAKFFQLCMVLLIIGLGSLPQFGFILAIVVFVSLGANFVCNAALGAGYYDRHEWPVFLSLMVSSAMVWSIGALLAKRADRRIVVIEQKTGRRANAKDPAVDWLVWPMKYWSAAILAVGLIYLVDRAFK